MSPREKIFLVKNYYSRRRRKVIFVYMVSPSLCQRENIPKAEKVLKINLSESYTVKRLRERSLN